MSSTLITTERKQNYPILIVDKYGLIGKALAEKIKEDSLVVLVTSLKLDFSDNIIHIPYLKKFPTIPDNIYSHIFIIDETANFFKEVFHVFLNKAKNDKSELVTVFHATGKEKDLVDKILDYKKSKVILYRDVFGQEQLDKNSYVNKFISQIKTSGKIEVPSAGLKTVHPVFFEDFINGILEAAFVTSDKENIINIFPKQGITLISLVRLFQKIDPRIKISFSASDEEEKELSTLENGTYVLGEKYPLEEKLKKVDLDGNREYVDNSKKPKNFPIFKRLINAQILIACIIIILLLPIINVFSFSYFGSLSLNSFEEEVIKNNLNGSKTDLYAASCFLAVAKVSFPLFAIEANFLKQEARANKIGESIDSDENVSNMFLSLTDFIDNFKYGNNFLQSINDLRQATYLYEKENSEGNISSSLANRIGGLISFASNSDSALPGLLSINGNKTYLILFEDNNNLRPSGGIISSYGILKIQNGKIIEFSIHNTDEADNLLKLRIEPPFPVRRYVPVTTWYLKDSNFDPDFSKSALATAMTFNNEKNQRVDGVIAVDLYFAKDLLSLVGPTYINDYNLTIDQDNVFQKTAENASKLESGKNFTSALFDSLFKELSQKSVSELSLFNIFSKSISEKHIIFAFNDVGTQETFSANGFSSSLEDTRPQTSNLVNDFLGISEANLGGDEVNNFIIRNISEAVIIGNSGNLSSTLSVSYNNTSEKGDYKNYLRIILPKGSEITSITIDNQSQKIIQAITDPAVYEGKRFAAPTGLEVNKEEEQGKTIFGFLINIPAGQQKIIKINYKNQLSAPISTEEFTYSLRMFKQPGIDNYPFQLTVSYPNNFDFQISQDFKKQEGQAIYNETISRDKDLNLNLNKK